MKKLSLLLLLIISTITFAVAQTELRYEHYTIGNGLSSNYTTKIKQDKYGFLWVGTIDGLNCFNGYEFTTYFKNEKDLNSLSENSINDLLIDKQGTLWIATNIGLNKYIRPSDNFQRYFCSSSTVKNATENLIINAITETDDGHLWLSTDKGIRILNAATNEIVQLKIKNDSLRKFIESGIGSIYFDANGVVWLGSSVGLGLRLADAKTFEPILFSPGNKAFPEANTSVRGFYKDRNSTLWILSDNGLYAYRNDNNLLIRYVSSLRPNDSLSYSATSIIEGSDNQLWVSLAAQPPHYTSIAIVDSLSNTFKIFPYMDNDDRGLSWSFCSFIFEDKSGIFWVGTSRGLDKMDPLCQQFKLYQSFSNLKYSQYNNVYSIYKDTAATWLGTDGKGLVKYDLKTRQFKAFFDDNSSAQSKIFAILPLDDGTLLLGADDVWQFNPKTNNVQLFLKATKPNSNTVPLVSSIIKGDNDNIWIAFMGSGLTQYNLKTGERKNYQHNKADATTLNSDQTNIVFRDSRGIIWVGSANGVNIIENGLVGSGLDRFNAEDGTFTHFTHRENDTNSISGNNIICIAEDKNGFLWVGTRNDGINKFDTKTGRFKNYTKADGLPSNFITAIQVDELNRIWMSTFTNGMACLDQSTNKISVIDIPYGLQNIRFNRQSTFKTKEGELFFGGVSGFNSFFPSTIKFNTLPPPVLITGIKINNTTYFSDTSVLDTRTLQLNYQQSELQFDFVAMNYSQSYKNQYAYQLVGYDKKWINAGTGRTAKYTNLDPGEYIFKVKACNNDGVWNETGAAISIFISPPWWQTWWAIIGYFLGLTGVIVGYAFVRAESLRKENKKLEEKVNLRTKELEIKTADLQNSLTELNTTQAQLVQQEKLASLGALTAGIAHEIKNPLNFVNNFSELSNELIKEFKESKSEEERNEILSDLELNLSKINEHGKRADSIVKNMLAHSRTGTSEKQLTDINQLCEEYFNLAFHGKRASNSSFRCEMIKQLDNNLPRVNCVTQDISRVILNLIGNAFDAVRERESEGESEGERAVYYPTVTLITEFIPYPLKLVRVRIKDNGKGIPQHIKEKIFEPFFTTKPAGKGTGLGLSLSNDIVKSHGGELTVESKEGEGCEFIITLPVV